MANSVDPDLLSRHCLLTSGYPKTKDYYGILFLGKYVPEEAVLDMKANFKLPLENDDNFDYIEYTDLPREKAVPLVEA